MKGRVLESLYISAHGLAQHPFWLGRADPVLYDSQVDSTAGTLINSHGKAGPQEHNAHIYFMKKLRRARHRWAATHYSILKQIERASEPWSSHFVAMCTEFT